MKKHVILIAALLLSTIFFILPSVQNDSVSASWWNASWTYMKVIQITNPSASYQMKVWVNKTTGNINCSGHCNNNFSDVRFTSGTNTTLDFYMQNKSDGNWAIFYVETSGSSTMNMYYGNTVAPPASNGTNTFLMFDSFEYAGNITGYGWTWDHGPTLPKTYVSHDGARSIRLQHQKPSTYFHRHYAAAGVFHYFFYDNKTFNGVGQELTSVADTRWDVDVGHNRVTSSTMYTKTKAAVTTTIANVTKQGGAWHEVEFTFKGSNISLKLDGVRIFSNWTDNMDELFFYCNELANTTTQYDWYVDGVWVRKWAYTTPVLGSVSAEHDISYFPVPPFPIRVSSVTPSWGATYVKTNPVISIHVVHLTGALLNITFYSGNNVIFPGSPIDKYICKMNFTGAGFTKGIESNSTYYAIYHGHDQLADEISPLENPYLLNHKYYWRVNITDGMGHARTFPNTTDNDGLYFYNFTTGLVNNTDDLTIVDNTVNTTGTNQYAFYNVTGWKIWINQTGVTTPLHLLEWIHNATGHHWSHLNSTGYWVNATYNGTAAGGVVVVGSGSNRSNSFLLIGLFGGMMFGLVLWRRKKGKKEK